MIVVTGATGQLGKLVIEALLGKVPVGQIVAAVRNPAKAADLAAKGVQVREADYARPETLATAFAGATRVLLISGSEIGQRIPQHKAVIDAAKAAGAGLLAYTSILHADTSPLLLAAEHLATEQYLVASGLPYALLRNGWYTENYTVGLQNTLQHGVIFGASGEGRIATAARADYAVAAAAVLTGSGHENQTYELAGDSAFTLTGFAAELSRQSGQSIRYQNLTEAEFEKILTGFLPPPIAHLLADSSARAAGNALDDSSHTLSRIIGHPTTPISETLAAALAAIR
ncbi:SDR family oxidoreductase [Silvibacterium dinghuense]|uniref:SDR family oxidoreductase n=1 Tax=Silvibacterium dinghuense TaxID=1560006 RepID=A0A4Q1SIT7_9BACT|nr:SDR family oxidoreductase [Silvibacterium dinghuense]RXS97319.1 SDR family oxidoreductase [Silvibacterium dinghuense]GGG98020.1 NAD(P)-dependent oxidoreductase [Silvibacterium dinghuense]